MKKNFKKLTSIFAITVFAGFLTACGGDGGTPANVSTPTNNQGAATDNNNNAPAATDNNNNGAADNNGTEPADLGPPSRDLGGMEFIIGNWWGTYDTDTFQPTTALDEAVLEMRIAAEQRYNFRMREVTLGGWGEIQELAATSIMAGDPAAHIFLLEPQWFSGLRAQNLLFPVSELPSVDFTDTSRIEWNPATMEATTVAGQTFGWSSGIIDGGGIYFNMRLFAEAGLDPELPFDLQARGQWTWDAFMDIARALTRDTDNDGIMDEFAMATFSNDILLRALASNRAAYVGRDPETGHFYRATGTPEFLEALTFVNNLHVEGLLMPQPEGSEWDWFNEAFWQGNVAMRTGGHYMGGSHINPNLADDWGYVAFPIGPNGGGTHRFLNSPNISVIPATFSPEEADDIMFAFQLWMDTPEGFDDPDQWKNANFVNFRHPRSVEETMLITRDQSLHSMAFNAFIPGLQVGDIAWQMWHEGADPIFMIERDQQAWEAIIYDANN